MTTNRPDPAEKKSDVTVVILAKDEGGTIGDVVRGCLAFTPHVLVADGASADDTASNAKAAGAEVIEDGGGGKGKGIRAAIPHVHTGIAVFIDADGSHSPDDIPSLTAPIRRGVADYVIGSRLFGGSSELHGGFDEFFRLAGGAFITACINWRFKVRLSDSQNGYRAIRTEALRHLDLKEDSTTIEQEMTIKALRLGYRVVDVPSHEHRRKFGKSHINVAKAAFRYLFSMVKYLLTMLLVMRFSPLAVL